MSPRNEGEESSAPSSPSSSSSCSEGDEGAGDAAAAAEAARKQERKRRKEEKRAERMLPSVDNLLQHRRDAHSSEVKAQLQYGTCPSLDARLRLISLRDAESTPRQRLVWEDSTFMVKDARKKRVVETLAELQEALLEEIQVIEPRVLLRDRLAFFELVSGFARQYDAQFAIQYARDVISQRLQDSTKRTKLCERMLSPLQNDSFTTQLNAHSRKLRQGGGSSSGGGGGGGGSGHSSKSGSAPGSSSKSGGARAAAAEAARSAGPPAPAATSTRASARAPAASTSTRAACAARAAPRRATAAAAKVALPQRAATRRPRADSARGPLLLCRAAGRRGPHSEGRCGAATASAPSPASPLPPAGAERRRLRAKATVRAPRVRRRVTRAS